MYRQREVKAAVSHVKCTDFFRAIIRHQHLVGQLRSVYIPTYATGIQYKFRIFLRGFSRGNMSHTGRNLRLPPYIGVWPHCPELV